MHGACKLKLKTPGQQLGRFAFAREISVFGPIRYNAKETLIWLGMVVELSRNGIGKIESVIALILRCLRGGACA